MVVIIIHVLSDNDYLLWVWAVGNGLEKFCTSDVLDEVGDRGGWEIGEGVSPVRV